MKRLLLLLNVVYLGLCHNHVWLLKINRENNCPSPDPSVPIEPNFVINEFTFCGKYNFNFLRRSTLMSLGSTDIFLEMYSFETKKVGLLYDSGYYFFDFQNQTFIPYEWYKICFAISMNQLNVALNGETSSNEKVGLEFKNIEKAPLWFGVQKHSSEPTGRLEGSITDVYHWNKSLKVEHLSLITSNETIPDLPPPDLFAWPPLDPISNQPCYEYLSVDENDELLQNDPAQKILLDENYKNFKLSNLLCQAYGGKLFTPKNNEDLSKLTTLFHKSGDCSDSYIGLKKSNDMIVDFKGINVSFVKWGKNQPNGKDWQQCIVAHFDGKDLEYDDVNCITEFCYSCQIPTKNTYKLRGNITLGAEREYLVGLGMMSNDTKIRGFTETECFWNGLNNTWVFGQKLQLEKSTNNMPPVGVNKWNNGEFLKFTQCHHDEFSCHTYGNCISMTKRCDGYPDCPGDGSDENECEFMTLIKGYNKIHSPAKNTNVSISIFVYNIREIDSEPSS